MGQAADYTERLSLLDGALESRRLDSLLVTNTTNVSYLSGFRGHDSLILATKKRKFFITDSRYIEEAKGTLKGLDIIPVKGSTYETLKNLISKARLKRTGFESMNLPYEVAARLKGMISPSQLVPVKGLVEQFRAIKDGREVRAIKDSIRLAKIVLAKIACLVKPGIAEKKLSETAALEFIKRGAKTAFDPIVASGKNSSRPHAIASDQAIEKNSFTMIDIGCSLNGYNSDITRMVVSGKIKDKFKKIYNVVRTAQGLAIEKIRAGIMIRDIDMAARGHIRSRGFGKYFGHSLGHGVGMEVHEDPTVSALSEGFLRSGMVITVEPAIYIPGFGGVRIEDMVLVTDKGCEILTR